MHPQRRSALCRLHSWLSRLYGKSKLHATNWIIVDAFRFFQAPEVLRGKPYTYSVDYWSLGCIFFEFLAGFPPFSGGTPEETWTNLKNWTKVLRRPEYDKPEDLVFNL